MRAPIRVVVGRIGRAHGIRGDLAVELRTDEPERRFAAGQVVHTPTQTLTVSKSRWHSGRLLVTFAEVPDRTAAELLRGALLEADVDPDALPSDEGEFYDRQLIGLEVRTEAGLVVGTVASVAHHGEQDTLVVSRGTGDDVLVPFVTEIVPTVDLPGGYLSVANLPGLLDFNVAE